MLYRPPANLKGAKLGGGTRSHSSCQKASIQGPAPRQAAGIAWQQRAHQAAVSGAARNLGIASQDIQSECLDGRNSSRRQQAACPPRRVKGKRQGQHAGAHRCREGMKKKLSGLGVWVQLLVECRLFSRQQEDSVLLARRNATGHQEAVHGRLLALGGKAAVQRRQQVAVFGGGQRVRSRSQASRRRSRVLHVLLGHPPLLSSVKTLLRALAPPDAPDGISWQ